MGKVRLYDDRGKATPLAHRIEGRFANLITPFIDAQAKRYDLRDLETSLKMVVEWRLFLARLKLPPKKGRQR